MDGNGGAAFNFTIVMPPDVLFVSLIADGAGCFCAATVNAEDDDDDDRSFDATAAVVVDRAAPLTIAGCCCCCC